MVDHFANGVNGVEGNVDDELGQVGEPRCAGDEFLEWAFFHVDCRNFGAMCAHKAWIKVEPVWVAQMECAQVWELFGRLTWVVVESTVGAA